jgi:hydroxymethylbilane synthase
MRLGTRGSALALAQANWVAERIEGPVEIVTFSAAGPVADKSRWVSALEQALIDGEIDAAVHSAKDVPGRLPSGLGIVAVPTREDPRDAICGAPSLSELAAGARVGTSSLRRAAQIRAARDDLEVVEIRGNVDTRLRKLAEGECDALVLALAGLNRLGLAADGVLDELVPAAGQGALAIEAANRSDVVEQLVRDLDEPHANVCLRAERELMLQLGASCDTPVGAYARVVEDGVELTAWVGLPNGSEWISDRLVATPHEVSHQVAARLASLGAGDLLRRAAA